MTITLYFNKSNSMDIAARARHVGSLASVNTQAGIRPSLAQLGCLA